MGQFPGLVRKPAQIGLVAIIAPDEHEARGLDAAATGLDPRHHADPVGMAAAAMAGVEGEAAQPVIDRPSFVDFDRQAIMRAVADDEIGAGIDGRMGDVRQVLEDFPAQPQRQEATRTSTLGRKAAMSSRNQPR